jgi:hypothetical protein
MWGRGPRATTVSRTSRSWPTSASAQYVVPPEMVERFGLIEVDFNEFERLYAAVRPSE